MATIFTNRVISGLYNTDSLTFTAVKEGGATIDFETTVTDSKDPLYVLVDLRNAPIQVALCQLNTDGKAISETILNAAEMNIIPVTTYGCIDGEGKAKFQLKGIGSDVPSGMDYSISSFSYTPVINH